MHLMLMCSPRFVATLFLPFLLICADPSPLLAFQAGGASTGGGSPRADTTTLGRSMIGDSFTPSAIPFPSSKTDLPAQTLYQNKANLPDLPPVKEANVPVPTGGRRRPSGLASDPFKLGALVASVVLLGGAALLMKRRPHLRPMVIRREDLHVIRG